MLFADDAAAIAEAGEAARPRECLRAPPRSASLAETVSASLRRVRAARRCARQRERLRAHAAVRRCERAGRAGHGDRRHRLGDSAPGVARGGPRCLAGACRGRSRLRCSRRTTSAAARYRLDCRARARPSSALSRGRTGLGGADRDRAHALGKPERQRRRRPAHPVRRWRRGAAVGDRRPRDAGPAPRGGCPSRPPTRRWPRRTSRSTRFSRSPGMRWSPIAWPRIVCAGATILRRQTLDEEDMPLAGLLSLVEVCAGRDTASVSGCWSCRPSFSSSPTSRSPTRTRRFPGIDAAEL